jgi:hypothetical protein
MTLNLSLTLADARDTTECGKHTGPYAITRFRPYFVRDAAEEVGRVWGSFRILKGSRRGCNGDGGALASAGQLDYHRYYAVLAR